MFPFPFEKMTSFGESGYSTQYGFFNKSSIYSRNSKKEEKKERPEIFSLIGIGDSIFDIISEIKIDLIKKYGLESNKTTYANQNTIKIFDEIEAMPEVRYIPGGSIQNILRVLSCRLNQSDNNKIFNDNQKKKYKISMIGCVGDDDYKYKIYNSLVECGVSPFLEISKNERTSRCGVCIYNKKAYYIGDIVASKNITKKFISDNLKNILEHQGLLIEGYYLQYQFDICKDLCESFYNAKKLIVLTLNSSYVIKYYNEKVMDIANMSDIIYGNIEQAEELAELKGVEIKKIFDRIFKKLIPKDRILVISNDIEGAYCSKYNYKENHLEFIMQCFPQKIKSEEIVDNSGVGDSFLGGFLSEYLKGSSLYECLSMGNDTANVILHNYGCTFPKNFEMKKFNHAFNH